MLIASWSCCKLSVISWGEHIIIDLYTIVYDGDNICFVPDEHVDLDFSIVRHVATLGCNIRTIRKTVFALNAAYLVEKRKMLYYSPFSFSNYIVCPSIYGFCLHLWYKNVSSN